MLSVCTLARDSASTLAATLASVRGLAHEHLVTDTGSRDHTVQIARTAGADVDQLPWPDDFAAALNHLIARATQPWVLVLDSDETLLPHSVEPLRELIQHPDLYAATLLRRDLTDANDPTRYTRMRQLRLLRRDPQRRYVGRVHQQFAPSAHARAGALGQRVIDSALELQHTGFAGPQTRDKNQRNARLMELELQDRPDQFYFNVQLGRTYAHLNDPRGGPLLRRAAEQAATADARRRLPRAMLAQLLEHQVVSAVLPPDHPFAAGPALPPAEALRIAGEDFPDNAPLVHHRAAAAFGANDFARAARLLDHLLHLGRTRSYDADASFNPDILGPSTRLNLGAACVRLGRLDDARAHFAALHDDPTHGPAARANLAQLDALRG